MLPKNSLRHTLTVFVFVYATQAKVHNSLEPLQKSHMAKKKKFGNLDI